MPSLADAKTHNLPPAVFLQHCREIRDAKRLHDEAGMALARVKKAAKGVGVDLGALKIVEALSKLDDDEAEIRVRHAFEYATWLGNPIGTQASLFPAEIQEPEQKAKGEQQEWEAGNAGYLGGKGGKLRSDNPYPEGSPLHVQWDKGFLRGLKILAAELHAADKADKKSDPKSDADAQPKKPKTEALTPIRAAVAEYEQSLGELPMGSPPMGSPPVARRGRPRSAPSLN